MQNLPTRIFPALALLLALALTPLQVLALGGDPNLLFKPKALKAGQGYVLFSMVYQKSAFELGDWPCIDVELTPVVSEGSTGKKPKKHYLSTATGMHCNTAWKNEAAVVQEGDAVRVVILTAVPAGEYEIRQGDLQYSRAQFTMKGDFEVAGAGNVRVAAGQMAYAGRFSLQGAGLSVDDNWAKDSELLRKLRPELAQLEVSMPAGNSK